MSPATLAVATLAIAVALVALPLRYAFAAFFGSLVLVPDTMQFPYGPSDQLPLVRLFPIIFLIGLVLRVGRGEIDRRVFRASPAHVGLVVFASVAWVLGVALAHTDIPPTYSRDLWLQVIDQIVVLVGAVAAVRAIGSVRAAASVASVTAIAAVIAIGERVTGASYAEWLFHRLPDQQGVNAVPLEHRAGQVRPRVATRFALAYAWQAAMALPVVVAVAITNKRFVRVVAVPAVLGAIVFTSTRSVYLGIVVGFGLLALLSGRRKLAIGLALVLLVGGAYVLSTGGFSDTFNAPEAAGSTDTRLDRAPLVLDIASAHPVTGSGYGSLLQAGLPGTDSSLLQIYAELGAVGLAAVGLSVAMALAAIVPAFTDSRPLQPQRLVAAGCWAGIAISLVGAGSFDLFTGPQTALPLWALAAVGIAAAEEVSAAERSSLQTVTRRAGLPVAGILIGLLVLFAAPRASTFTADVDLLNPASDAISTSANDFVGRTLAHSACDITTSAAAAADVDTSCFLPFGSVGGAIRLRISSSSSASVDAASARAFDALGQQLPSAITIDTSRTNDARPAWATTAPVAGGALGVALAVLIPVLSDRDRRWVAASDSARGDPVPARGSP